VNAGIPVAEFTAIDASLLRGMPSRLSLRLPGVRRPLRVVRRFGIKTHAEGAPIAGVSISSTRGRVQRFPRVWIGSVAGSKPGLSAVVLTLDEATNTVFGSVRFSDNSTRGFRVFNVSASCALFA
jgi:hypothetical protein